jgi:hypothetical protein
MFAQFSMVSEKANKHDIQIIFSLSHICTHRQVKNVSLNLTELLKSCKLLLVTKFDLV